MRNILIVEDRPDPRFNPDLQIAMPAADIQPSKNRKVIPQRDSGDDIADDLIAKPQAPPSWSAALDLQQEEQRALSIAGTTPRLPSAVRHTAYVLLALFWKDRHFNRLDPRQVLDKSDNTL